MPPELYESIVIACAYGVLWGFVGLFGTMFVTAFGGEPDEDGGIIQNISYCFWSFLAGPIIWCMLLYFWLRHCRRI